MTPEIHAQAMVRTRDQKVANRDALIQKLRRQCVSFRDHAVLLAVSSDTPEGIRRRVLQLIKDNPEL